MNEILIIFVVGIVHGMFLYIICLAVYDILSKTDIFEDLKKFFGKKL